MPETRDPILPSRLRRTEGSFAFLPHRFLRGGFFRSLTATELRLYLLLVLVADRHGISFYSHQRLCDELCLGVDAYLVARDGLMRKDLIAVRGTRVQVLSLPPRPIVASCPPLDHDQQLAACQAVLATLVEPARR
jgi:hypothetical protein